MRSLPGVREAHHVQSDETGGSPPSRVSSMSKRMSFVKRVSPVEAQWGQSVVQDVGVEDAFQGSVLHVSWHKASEGTHGTDASWTGCDRSTTGRRGRKLRDCSRGARTLRRRERPGAAHPTVVTRHP